MLLIKIRFAFFGLFVFYFSAFLLLICLIAQSFSKNQLPNTESMANRSI